MSGNAPQAPRARCLRVAVREFGPFIVAMRAQWEAFEQEAQTGWTLELVSLNLHDLEASLFTNGGMADGEWDIAFVATDWVARMQELGCAVDLAPLLAADPPEDWPHGWTPSLLRLQTVGARVLGVPFHDGPECLIVRQDLFDDPAQQRRFREQFGAELALPRTWEQFHQLARFFQDPAKHRYGTVFAAFPDGHNSVYDFLLQLWTRGGEILTPDGRLRLQTSEAEAALRFYRRLLTDEAAVHPECLQLDSVGAGERFAAGEVAMMVNWFGFAAFAHTSPASAVKGCVNVSRLPADPGRQSVSLNVYWLLSIARGSLHQPIAWQFLRHIMSPPMDRLTTLSGAIGCRRSTWNDPEINRLIPFYRQLEQLHGVAREIPWRADWPAVAHAIDRLVTEALTTPRPIRDLLAEADKSLGR